MDSFPNKNDYARDVSDDATYMGPPRTSELLLDQLATFGASYSTPTGATLLKRAADAWQTEWSLKAVVLPMGCGKSTLAHNFGGYDIDDVVVNTEPLACDKEWAEMVDNRTLGWRGIDTSAYVKANATTLKRASHFFRCYRGDCNMPVLYTHTTEMAVALGAEVIFVGHVASSCFAASPRMSELSAQDRANDLRVHRGQINGNAVFGSRNGISPGSEYYDYDSLAADVVCALRKHGLLDADRRSLDARAVLLREPSMQVVIETAHDMCKDETYTKWVRAVAGRLLRQHMGGALPQEAYACHNHPTWARILGAMEQYRKPEALASDFPAKWSDKFPYGAGNSRFALVRISDWLSRASPNDTNAHYHWFRQQLHLSECSYERGLAMLLMGDVFWYVAPQLESLAKCLPMGSLESKEFAEVSKAIHQAVRSSGTLLGARLSLEGMGYCTYWNCLSGRYLGTGDMSKEIEDRTTTLPERQYVMPDGSASKDKFDEVFREEVRALLHQAAVDGGAKMRRTLDVISDFDTFLDYRKKWVRPGSVTGSPKADMFIKAIGDREEAICEMADDVAAMGTYVLRKLRLNKAAVFEFAELPKLVKDVIKNYVPNSFTRHFIKNEIGKPEGRALYPSHVVHYIVGTFVLYALMHGEPIPHVRLVAQDDLAMEEHWIWQQARDFTVGLMLDYDNFNEKHEIPDMQMVISELKGLYRVAGVLGSDLAAMIDWIVEAYELMIFEYDGEQYKFLHGMLSGQAPTSAMNSIINGANKRVLRRQVFDVTGRMVMQNRTSGGDDVASETYSAYDAMLTIKLGQRMNFAFNDVKQLLSANYYEFFRLFIGSDGVYGSLPRALGSISSGQWSNSVKAKFVEPASKLSSVVDMAWKLSRRASNHLSFQEKLCTVAFRKWASYNEVQLVGGYVHSERRSGGLGVPMWDGAILEIEQIEAPTTAAVELLGLPTDASVKSAKQQVDAARTLVGDHGVEDINRLAYRMSEMVFKSNVAAAEGVATGQLLGAWEGPRHVKVKRKKNITAIPRTQRVHGKAHFERMRGRWAHSMSAYKNARAKYQSMASAVKPEYKMALATAVSREFGCEAKRLHFWMEELTFYGCGTYLLTEDTYSAAQLLAVVTAGDLTNEAFSERLAEYAMALDKDRLVSY